MSSGSVSAPPALRRAQPSELLRRPDSLLTGIAVVLVLVAALTTEGFLTTDNFKAILASAGILGIVSVGMMMITLSGCLFSLSLGITVTVGSLAFMSWLDLGVVPAILGATLLGAAICAVQGFAIGGFGANPIIVTIAFGALQTGVAMKLTDGETVYPDGKGYELLADSVFGLPVGVYVLLGIVVAIDVWLRRSRLGREIHMVGENRRAARAAALRVTRSTVVAFAIAGACAALAGVLLGATNKSANLITAGDQYTFNAIAVVLVGGIAVSGGRGSAWRALVGVVFIAALSDLMLLRGYSGGVQILVTGLAVLLAILIMRMRERRWAG